MEWCEPGRSVRSRYRSTRRRPRDFPKGPARPPRCRTGHESALRDAEDFFQLLETGRHRRLGDAAGFGCPPKMPLFCERQQKFKLVDQEMAPRSRLYGCHEYHGRSRTNTSKAASEASLLDFHIVRFCNRIDRVSVSQHETALLIFGAIPILIEGADNPLTESADDT